MVLFQQEWQQEPPRMAGRGIRAGICCKPSPWGHYPKDGVTVHKGKLNPSVFSLVPDGKIFGFKE
jgi:hypothetical protein